MTLNENITDKKYCWRCSPNIAIVKYWGKLPGQLPASPSVSLTLSESYTVTSLRWLSGERGVHFAFNGEPAPLFGQRIEKYLETLQPQLPWLSQYGVAIESSNNFPHSAGIASSASSFGALALCLAETHLDLRGVPRKEFLPFASHLARLGSGSAARSIYGGFNLWGATPGIADSSDLRAIPIIDIHPVFADLHDLIVVVSDQKKSVSSSRGHALMNQHPYAAERYSLARERAASLPGILKSGDMDSFCRITISEGLGLHGLMLTSDPPVNLLEPLSVEIIRLADRFRKETGLPLSYTLDAGPNVHLIYPGEMADAMNGFIENYLMPFTSHVRLIHDKAGAGSLRMSIQ
ncbi:MAG TPA: diphosphomevalonate decarboxylase [Bacteroidales bacterium]|nr:diphosphomevalonate decarboxylase [Bacteroidales bacterium]HBZ68138.1 diphosphomevalonate decarboxylase [Bacteroidales bacterium]